MSGNQMVAGSSKARQHCGNIIRVPGNNGGNPATHFGRQMRKERVARGWSIHELSARMGIAAGHLSRIENGKRPPTEGVAAACDAAFPERKGWFREFYEESRTWAPPGFRDWPEYENKAARLCDWWPSVVSGLLQTESYARALLETHPGVTDEIVAARLANRMERQRRVLQRDDPPAARYIIDHAALYRLVGTPDIMAGQMLHLAAVAAMPNVTVQVLPAVAHPATQSGFLIADDAAYTEHVVGGLVFTEPETVTVFERLFDSLRAECYRASESAAIIRKAGAVWTGESRATAALTAELA
jgi:transcriptional regulator with XRE-family HTH domain